MTRDEMQATLQNAFAGPAAAQGEAELRDSGLVALSLLLGVHNIVITPEQLRHALGHAEAPTADDLILLAKRQQGVRAKAVDVPRGGLARQPLPAIADGPDGWFVIGGLTEHGVIIQRPGHAPEQVDRDGLDAIWSGTLVLLTTRAVAGRPLRFGFSWFTAQFMRYRKLFLEVLGITLALNLLGLAAPLLFQSVIDKVLIHNSMSTLSVLAFAFLAVSIWEVALGWIRTRLFTETTQKIDVELGARLFHHLLALPLSYFEKRRVGDTVTRVRQLETIREFLTNASLTVMVDPLFTLVFLAAMLVYSPMLSGIVLVSLVLYAIVSFSVAGPLRARVEDKFEKSSASNALLVESVSGIHTIKATAVEPHWQNRWERQLAAYTASSQRLINTANTGSQTIELISKLSFAAILFFGAQAVIGGALSVGALVAFNMFAQRVSGPVIRMAQLWQDFQQVRIAIERLGDVLNHPVEPRPASAATLPTLHGAIRFENVSFRYAEDQPPVLSDITLDIPAGSSLGIVGSSGSGKSTLAKLLQRLNLPSNGRVLVDEVDIAQLDPAWLRRQIGVVLQENLLFSRTIRENIALSNPAMPFEHVVAAATLAGAHDFILRQPRGYDTEIVERGVNLSGGQRQRLAIARALVGNPRILVFDEATSALDAESEELIQNNLRAISAGRTLVIIAHRLSAVRGCDRIITLEQGRIVESGRHDELLRLGGRYADLHRRQGGYGEIAA
ncbi:Leukotoxin export ATP-binding protein LtxB [Sphingomonas sp. S2M10]|uniref:type I secretion system permease/ATPase n=1 Tax=Sphingomonas sp. S2M10 TaxID=2705010 RepID=UPI001456D06B|nr:type I secretion system permease/ATPase [Sphingomonas sp. S2M10]NLS25928.1 Leukotoxin export ATP-binding protein LtxB [Sphingomonas sp. S2M10]